MKKSNMKSSRHVRSLIVSSTNWCSTSPFRPLLRRRAVWLGWQRAAPARRYEAGFRWSLEQFWAACFRGICMDLQIWQCWRWKMIGTCGRCGNKFGFNWSQVPSPTLTPTEDPYFFVFLPGIPVGRRCHWCSGGSLGCCESFRSLWCGSRRARSWSFRSFFSVGHL